MEGWSILTSPIDRRMRVFVLEDDSNRVMSLFKWLPNGVDWDIIDTCEKADRFNPPYDLILLDHDLGGRQFEKHEDCGLTFVKLIKDKIPDNAAIILHSYNHAGAQNMLAALEDRASVIPFGTAAYIAALKGMEVLCGVGTAED